MPGSSDIAATARYLAAVDELERRTYECYVWSLPTLKTRDIAEAIQYGIVVGDDPAMTCAAVLRRLTGERHYWEDVG